MYRSPADAPGRMHALTPLHACARRRIRAFAPVVLVPQLAGLLGAAPVVAQSEPRFRPADTIDDVVGGILESQRVPGAIVAVVHGDGTAYLQAFGRTGPEPGAPPLEPGAAFHAAGFTELVTALAAVALAASGGVRLDQPLGTRVPGVPPELRAVTVEQLITHTAGMSRQLAVPGRGGADDLGAAARQLTRFDRVTDPGLLYSFSPTGLALAGLALQTAAGRPYPDVVRSTVLEPLGMTGSGLATDMTAVGLTPGWVSTMMPDPPIAAVAPARDSAALLPVRGFHATAADLAALAAVLLSDGVLRGDRVLPAGVAAELWRPRAAVPASGMKSAPGMRIGEWEGRRSARITSRHRGHHVLMQLLPDHEIAVVALANNESAQLGEVAEFVLRRTLDLGPRVASAAPRPAADPAVLEDLAAHAGPYENGSELIEIVVVDGAPMLKSEELLLPLAPLGDGAIGALLDETRAGLVFRLIRDDRGRTYLWIGDRVLSPESVRKGGR